MRRMHIVSPILILGFIFSVGLILTKPSQAQNDPIWFPFDGNSQPSKPILSLLSAIPTEIELHATLPGAYAETVTAACIC
jgi:hypothetical protein